MRAYRSFFGRSYSSTIFFQDLLTFATKTMAFKESSFITSFRKFSNIPICSGAPAEAVVRNVKWCQKIFMPRACVVFCAKIWPLFSQIENWPHKLKRHKAFSNHFTTVPGRQWVQNDNKVEFGIKILFLWHIRQYFDNINNRQQ